MVAIIGDVLNQVQYYVTTRFQVWNIWLVNRMYFSSVRNEIICHPLVICQDKNLVTPFMWFIRKILL